MPDPHFALPRLAAIYDDIDGARDDLDHYVAIIEGLHARSVVDVGCGTGSLACRLAGMGLEVTGVDPARASLDIARRKVDAERVRWVHGTAADLRLSSRVDLAVMTGNVAQVFVDDDDWTATLRAVHRVLRPTGHFVFETRDPGRRGWEEWTTEQSRTVVDILGVGPVEYTVDLLDVSLPLVSFRSTYRFLADGSVLTSDSTLRFRTIDEVTAALEATCFEVHDVRDAPDRPGRELVFIASPSG